MDQGNFIDRIRIFFSSGNGGDGSRHFHRERHNPKGGPDGGDGGKGGDIVIRGNRNLWTLLHLKYLKHINATHGQNGGARLCTGKSGKNRIVEVPLGTIIKDQETGKVNLEIVFHGQEEVLLPGGRGGKGNSHFKNSIQQSPKYAQPGQSGKKEWKILELKLLADVGLVGKPNAGKSTLLSVVSEAKPKIANYPFTTLVPNLGVVKYKDDLSFVMADIPGIIEGASQGRGLGLKFLRHIERNSVLLFMIPSDAESIKNEYELLLNELEEFSVDLLNKPKLLAITKSDLIDDELKKEIIKDLPEEIDHIFLSSLNNYNIDSLKNKLWQLLQQ